MSKQRFYKVLQGLIGIEQVFDERGFCLRLPDIAMLSREDVACLGISSLYLREKVYFLLPVALGSAQLFEMILNRVVAISQRIEFGN